MCHRYELNRVMKQCQRNVFQPVSQSGDIFSDGAHSSSYPLCKLTGTSLRRSSLCTFSTALKDELTGIFYRESTEGNVGLLFNFGYQPLI